MKKADSKKPIVGAMAPASANYTPSFIDTVGGIEQTIEIYCGYFPPPMVQHAPDPNQWPYIVKLTKTLTSYPEYANFKTLLDPVIDYIISKETTPPPTSGYYAPSNPQVFSIRTAHDNLEKCRIALSPQVGAKAPNKGQKAA